MKTNRLQKKPVRAFHFDTELTGAKVDFKNIRKWAPPVFPFHLHVSTTSVSDFLDFEGFLSVQCLACHLPFRNTSH